MFPLILFVMAAIFEIGGCFLFWSVFRSGRSFWLLAPGCVCLLIFAWLLTLVPVENAGRAFAVYGGIYIVTSLFWAWAVDGSRPDLWDLGGAAVCLIGAGLIFFGPRPL